MKKIVGIIAAAALCAGMATAQDDAGIKLGSWSKAIFIPIGYDGNDAVAGIGTSWGDCYRIGVDIIGVSEYAGFQISMHGSDWGMQTHDFTFAWVKPFDFMTIKVGQCRDEWERRDATFGMYSWYRMGDICDVDENFTGQKIDVKGAVVELNPTEALHIGMGFNIKDTTSNGWNGGQTADINGDKIGKKAGFDKAEDVFCHQSSIIGCYNLEGIGTIRAGFWEWDTHTDVDGEDQMFSGLFNVGFDLTAVENLWLSIGAYIPAGLQYWGQARTTRDEKTYATPFDINIYGNYAITDTIKLHALLANRLQPYAEGDGTSYDDGKMQYGLRVGVGADIGLTESISLMLDGRFTMDSWMEKNDPDADWATDHIVAFGVGVKKAVSNGWIGLGFEGGVNCASDSGWMFGTNNVGNNEDTDPLSKRHPDYESFHFVVPVVLEVFF